MTISVLYLQYLFQICYKYYKKPSAVQPRSGVSLYLAVTTDLKTTYSHIFVSLFFVNA